MVYSHPATLPPPTTCTIPHYPASSTLQIQSHPPITIASLHSTPPPLAYPLLTLDPITSDLNFDYCNKFKCFID
ncbi:hypothetical protein CROQUDRAFT_102667 [Cronartium quercuum f. sp. fusiforme G11]|uniref:Uncharacterized protein n=1 Tax=Cronartium quercuum f. sp. fusiforme G11 TaxID=708437 RepID=A0A9P6N4N8_9BASI|nr:hypothetical protein CROQUDRAFT_102667 [Cronartium quercuum f. sp. fusiforme G11]